MPLITALLHTRNDARRLGRALETLLPCSEILIVDHQSSDGTLRVAREYGGRIVTAGDSTAAHLYPNLARCDWIFCLDPSESITEALQATLFEWVSLPDDRLAPTTAFAVSVRQQRGQRWSEQALAETRLIPRDWTRWSGHLPAHEAASLRLEGELLRFAFP